jgi:Putative prokaryotic signal transducing protein
MNNETERERLARTYAEMGEEELGQLAADEKSLTEVARKTLEAELTSRGIGKLQPVAREPRQYSGPLVMVRRFRDLPEAFVARSILDSAEIDSFLADENLVRIDWLYSNLIGGAKLMVRPEDFQEATALLDESANEATAVENSEQRNESGKASE